MFYFAKIVDITSGKIITSNHPGLIKHFITDSRKVINPSAGIFIAIKGHQHDGHTFIRSLFDQGVRQYLVEQEVEFEQDILRNSNIIQVDNSIESLQKIASFHRCQFNIPVLGITGSNGKTIVKEWLGQLLAERYRIVKSPKSYNSQLGVPLSVLQITDWNTLAIFEAGISIKGEMEKLQKVIRPTTGIFTNIGSAHDEGFSDHDEKAREKWKLFRNCEVVIYCFDHEVVKKNKPKTTKAFSWGWDKSADLRIMALRKKWWEIPGTFRIQE
jgi:UDP-N-acetylmuramyl pentapeptide synthase